jgi:peptidoglycan/xylan/chitin deacetylase (PgdA/CDA1 family)
LTECSAGEVEDEIGGSARDIEDALGQAPRTFAYPYGAVNPAVARVAAAEFQIACTTRFQLVHQGARRELMPRLDSLYFRDASRLAHWGTRSFTRFVAVRRILRSMRRLAGWRGQRLSYASDIHDSFTCSEGPAG